MIQDWFQNNIFIYILLGVAAIGILVKFMLSMKYRWLIRASKRMGTTKNKLMRVLRLKFETCYKLKLGVNNVDTFVDKYMYRHKFCGLFLYTWETLSGEFVILCMLLGSLFAVIGLVNECGRNDILYTFLTGVLSCVVLITYDFFINIPMKQKVLKTNIKDYLENFLKARIEGDETSTELLEQYRKEYFDLPQQQAAEAEGQQKKQGRKMGRRKREAISSLSSDLVLETENKNESKDEGARRREAKKNELKRMILEDKERQAREEAELDTEKKGDLLLEEKSENSQEEGAKEHIVEMQFVGEILAIENDSLEEEKTDSVTAGEEESAPVRQESAVTMEIKEAEKESKEIEETTKETIIPRTSITEEEAKVIQDILREFLS